MQKLTLRAMQRRERAAQSRDEQRAWSSRMYYRVAGPGWAHASFAALDRLVARAIRAEDAEIALVIAQSRDLRAEIAHLKSRLKSRLKSAS